MSTRSDKGLPDWLGFCLGFLGLVVGAYIGVSAGKAWGFSENDTYTFAFILSGALCYLSIAVASRLYR